MYLTSVDGSQNMFFYQPTSDTLELKKDKGIDFAVSSKSKGLCIFKLMTLYTIFLYSRDLSGYKT